MSNLFLHLEDHTADFQEPALITEGDEGESVAAVIADLTQESAELAEQEREIEAFQDDVQVADEVVAAAEEAPQMESAGLTPSSARLMAKVLTSVGGKAYTARHMPKFEHFDSRSKRRDATHFVLESVSDSLKNFWEALKKQLAKAAEKIRTIYVKVFSGARRLLEKAEKVRDRAEQQTGSIENRNFEFNQAGTLAIGTSLKTTTDFETGFNALIAIVGNVNGAPSEEAVKAIKSSLDDLDIDNIAVAGTEFHTTISKAFEKFDSIGRSEVTDRTILNSLGAGEGGTASVRATAVLPGNKRFVAITSKDQDFVANLRISRLALIGADSKSKEVSNEVVTLNASQGAKYASKIVDVASVIYDYEKAFARVEGEEKAIIKKLDTLFNAGSKAAKENGESTSGSERNLRSTASAATTAVRRLTHLPAQVNQYALSVFDATLNWVEGSLRNHKTS